MSSCDDALGWIARRADGDALDPAAQGALDAHLTTCAGCRAALDDQVEVSALLRTRPADTVSPAFAAALASRLDEAEGWFGLADWRAWTFRLAPVAVALALAALLTSDTSAQSSSVTLEEWTKATAGTSSGASLLWQQDVSSEDVVETMLTGQAPTPGETK
jgi:anti-sigma factor RsiW